MKVEISLAIERFIKWIQLEQLIPTKNVSYDEAFDESVENDEWKGIAFIVSEEDGWTTFQNITGYLHGIKPEKFLSLAQDNELIFAGYNDTIPFGQIVSIENGIITKNIFDDENTPSKNINLGTVLNSINNWIDVESFVLDDELGCPPDKGKLLLFKETNKSL